MKKGDIVIFVIGNDQSKYEVITDEYDFRGRKVVQLKEYLGEVAVEYLKKIN